MSGSYSALHKYMPFLSLSLLLSSLPISAPDMAEMLLKIHEKFTFSIKRTNPPTRPESQRV